MVFNPEQWLTSLHRSLKDYIEDEINEYVRGPGDVAAGLEAYEVQFDWPGADELAEFAIAPKSKIHLVLDDTENTRIGFGNGVVDISDEFIVGNVTQFSEHEAQWHTLNYDVGFWASDKSGGSTARLVAYEMLLKVLGTDQARRRILEVTEGIEIVRFNGGRFVTDSINDVRMFRIIDSELVVRVSSRHVSGDPVTIADLETVQNPMLEIDDLPIT